MHNNLKICSKCVMDTTALEIEFDENDICSFCKEYEIRSSKDLHDDPEDEENLRKYLENIKSKRKNHKYDCLIGVSGGVDSSYVAYLLKNVYGLNPLAIHLDNGWNSELAVSNVENIMKILDIDLITHVLDWNEFKDIQLSFLKSSISNVEIPTDHAIWALLIKTASNMNIPYIVAGNNVVTESTMPLSWLYQSKDSRLIKSIHKRFGSNVRKTYPTLSNFDYVYYLLIKRIKWIPILNYLKYNKQEAKKTLITELGWRDYGGKHYESIFTRFFHSFYLMNKFGYDLRKPYLSAEICSGQITREQALQEISTSPSDEIQLNSDKTYVAKKLGLEEFELENIISSTNKTYENYPNSNYLWKNFSSLIKIARSFITRIG